MNGEVYSEYTPVEQKGHKKQSNDQWRQLSLFPNCLQNDDTAFWLERLIGKTQISTLFLASFACIG